MSESAEATTTKSNNNMDDDNEENETTTKQQRAAAATGDGGNHRPSISVRFIRHAESYNNQVYRNARYIYRGGTPDFDITGWTQYVDLHRHADPGLSEPIGCRQASKLAHNYMIQHVMNQVSQPLTIITSPMKRTLATIKPTIHGLQKHGHETKVIVHGFYFESEGCHIRDVPQEGMNPQEIQHFLQQREGQQKTNHDNYSNNKDHQHGNDHCKNDEQDDKNNNDSNNTTCHNNVSFVGFPDLNRGWYCNGTGAETRPASEIRAAKFYVWLCEYLDEQLLPGKTRNNSSIGNIGHDAIREEGISLSHHDDDVFDAGVSILPGEECEVDHDRLAPRQRKRRTVLLMGHGDFMSLVLKRIVAGFGHYVEQDGVPHRSAFIHYNTGITELEYFGHGRFLIMSHNAIPHLQQPPQTTTLQAAAAADEDDVDYASLRTGGSLKDGWSYLMPDDEFVLDKEVAVAFSDEQLQDNEHVREQTMALKSLYHLGSQASIFQHSNSTSSNIDDICKNKSDDDDDFLVEQQEDSVQQQEQEQNDKKSSAHTGNVHFIVQRGLQVVGVATYSEQTGIVSDVAIRPSGGKRATETLLRAVKDHAQRKLGRSGSLLIQPRTMELTINDGSTAAADAAANVMNQQLLDELGFEQVIASDTQPK